MESPLLQLVMGFASESAGKTSALDTLGIDLKQMIFQMIAFGILLFVLTKWVFPIFIKAIDERQAKIERSLSEAKKAEEKSVNAQAEIDKLLAKARKESADIVAVAHKEATSMIEDADAKAKRKADHIVAEAKAQLDSEILKAKAELAKDAKRLVADATEKIIGQKLTSASDEQLIDQTLKELK